MASTEGTLNLDAFLERAVAAEGRLAPAAKTLREIAVAAIALADLIGLGQLYGRLGASRGSANADGDVQKELDILANDLFVEAFRRAPVAAVASEELKDALPLDPAGPLAVAMDPLDGSSMIDANVSIGTIFSILPALPDAASADAHFLQPGRAQIAGGFVIYGPQTSLVFALGDGATQIFTLDRRDGRFHLAVPEVRIPADSNEYAINSSNYRHWEPAVRAYIDDCVQGAEGPLKRNYNMRWVASLVAEAYRILLRGGVFLYPGDHRPGYAEGRLRLIYEANPIALIVERAAGRAIDCLEPILDVVPASVHARTPLVFGSSNQVELVARYHKDPQFSAERAPLFGKRGLMRL
ncbi:class 1 fructose-bisphosphatase [Methylocapsa acidiphila]|uniref:class 1 fructose-bisphosphatase n=1 Tax=Methylocapsa acidiphila TaxID=133552 RepID=UPI0004276E7D|nr:class 1 fructose-bisphosphatase [Methylocapsa acidiphila]